VRPRRENEDIDLACTASEEDKEQESACAASKKERRQRFDLYGLRKKTKSRNRPVRPRVEEKKSRRVEEYDRRIDFGIHAEVKMEVVPGRTGNST